MPWTLERLLLQLDREHIPLGLEEELSRRKEESYKYLFNEILTNGLSQQQLAHTISLLYQLHIFIEPELYYEMLFAFIVHHVTHKDERIRNSAAFCAAHLVVLASLNSSYNRYLSKDDFINSLRKALQLGLKAECREYISNNIWELRLESR
ncbi:MAG: hypothetical protein JNN15_00450 [Blastocatellia bacterium]|nr:hypothetical protein [Blastocatellia bacterium]